ncbi:MAG: nodulation protein NfeD [Bacteroidales bacterium]|nr:nodulation protein NfeD [Bacteroidales bacterium]
MSVIRTSLFFILVLIGLKTFATTDEVLILKFDIAQEITPGAWQITKKAISKAESIKADFILIRINTYGGLVNSADSIRTRILNTSIPVIAFIDNNAASAGALIAIAADSIYMRKGASIGAATVVDQEGKVVPDKYQSYMRAIMRSTAQAHGKKPVIKNGDTLWVWHRDPDIAQAMVDPRIEIKGINDSGKVLTLTTAEAIAVGYCEGEAENIEEVLNQAGIKKYRLEEYRASFLDKIIGFLTHPLVQGILIMIIVGGIYFELQTPGVGFPLIAAATAAILYFSPLYLEGLAQHWEIILFIVGLILIALEIFLIPGFGVTGILGITLVIIGLTMAMVEKIPDEPIHLNFLTPVLKAFVTVVVSITLSLVLSIYLSSKIIGSRQFRLALQAEQKKTEGYVGVDVDVLSALVGKTGKSVSILRPAGKIEIDGNVYDAISESGFIDSGAAVKVVKTLAGQLYVVKI